MKSHYAQYLEELTSNCHMYEDDKGFFIYEINDKEFYMKEIYVQKEFRQNGVAKDYDKKAVEMAKEFGCVYIKGSVVPVNNGATISLKMQLALGYELLYCDGFTIYLKKELGE